jgi:endoglucanase
MVRRSAEFRIVGMRLFRIVTVLLCTTACPASWAETKPGADRFPVRLNSIGYLPESRKVATVRGSRAEFLVRDLTDNRVVLRGKTSQLESASSSQPVSLIDFSEVEREGSYRIELAGNNNSPEFQVIKGVYNWPFYCVTRAMYLWRCGTEVSSRGNVSEFYHPTCHTDDAYLDFVGGPNGKRKDGTGGWHDAGDYNKYTVNGAFTVGMMLTAWEHFHERLAPLKLDIPESGNQSPDFLNEARWELQWLLKMQADDGSVYHKLSTRKFGGFILPDKETERRYFTPWSSAGTADFVAVMAQAARVFHPFDNAFSGQCLAAAEKSYAFLHSHPEDHHPDLTAFETGPYDAPDSDDRLWAAAELWETAGGAEALSDCESRLNAEDKKRSQKHVTVDTDWDWGNVRNLGTFTYIRSRRPGRDTGILERVRQDALHAADSIVESTERHPYGRPLGDTYYWGCNGTVARETMNLNLAYELTKNRRYRDTMLDALNHLFGRNPYGRSFVTGLGYRPPLFPHDRRSGGDKIDTPWPGYLVGGPWPGQNDWVDKQESYQSNEIAINWNGALIYALAAFVEPEGFEKSIKRERERADSRSVIER